MSFDADLAQMFAEAMIVQRGQEARVPPPAGAPLRQWGPPGVLLPGALGLGSLAAAVAPGPGLPVPGPPPGPSPQELMTTHIADLDLTVALLLARVRSLEETVETMQEKLSRLDAY